MNKLIENLKKIEGGVSFVSTTYTNKQGELAQTTFNVGVDYKTAQSKDLALIEGFEFKANDRYDESTFNDAKAEMIISLRISLGIEDENITQTDKDKHAKKSKGQKDAYEHLSNGLKVHKESGALYVYGMKVSKKQISKGIETEDKRKAKTIAKDDMRAKMKSTKYRQFELSNATNFKLCGDEIIFA
jgi:hypothetical protein